MCLPSENVVNNNNNNNNNNDNNNLFCIDNAAVLADKVSQCLLACLMEGHQSSSFSL